MPKLGILKACSPLIIILLQNLSPLRGSMDFENVIYEEEENENPDIPYFDCSKKSLTSALDDHGELHASIFPRVTTDACTPDFLFCSEGVALPATCPSGLFFNPTLHDCDLKDNIDWCGAKAEEKKNIVHTWTKARPLLADVPFIDCTRKPCGFYPNEKSADGSTFIFCKEGEPVEKPCPEGSAYDYQRADCKLKDEAVVWTPPENLKCNMSKDHPLRSHDTGGAEGFAADENEKNRKQKFVPIYEGIKGYPPPSYNPIGIDNQTEVATIEGLGVLPETKKSNFWELEWTDWLLCPDLSFFVGFNSTDGLECQHPGSGGNSKFVMEFQTDHWNYLKDAIGSQGSVINGLSVGDPKTGEDGKAENVQFFFSNKPPGESADGEIPADFGNGPKEGQQYCPLKTAACGLNIQYNKSSEMEGVLITNARMECCPVPSPFEEPGYNPVEYMREVLKCNNIDSDSWKKCEFTVGVWGIVVPDELLHVGSFYASVGYTLDEIYKDVERSVKERGVKCGGDDDGDETDPPACWYDDWGNLTLESSKPLKIKRIETVPPFSNLILYQVYAQVGYMRIFTPKFVEVIETGIIEYPQQVEIPPDELKTLLEEQKAAQKTEDDSRKPVIAEQTDESRPPTGEDLLMCRYHAHESAKKIQREGKDTVILSAGEVTVTGKWKTWSNCSEPGQALDRMQMITETITKPDGKIDKAGIVQFGGMCKDINWPKKEDTSEVAVVVPNMEKAGWDDGKWRVCTDGVVVGFQVMRQTKEQSEVDDIGLETIKVICSCPKKEYFGDNRGDGLESGRGKLGMGGYAEIHVEVNAKELAKQKKQTEGDEEEGADEVEKAAPKKEHRPSNPARTEGIAAEKGKKIKAPRKKAKKDPKAAEAEAPPAEEKMVTIVNWIKRPMPGIPKANRTVVPNVEAENQNDDDALGGNWLDKQICKPDQALVGIKPKFLELYREKETYDNKGLMSFKAKCVDAPNHAAICEPEEKKITVATCKNERAAGASCKFSAVVGVTYDYKDEHMPSINIMESVGQSLACVIPYLRKNFEDKLGNDGATFWTETRKRSFWNTVTGIYGQIPNLAAGESVEITQIIGVCGPYKVYTNRFEQGGPDKPFKLPSTAFETLAPSLQQCWRDTEPIKMKLTEDGKKIVTFHHEDNKTLEGAETHEQCEYSEEDATDEYTETDGGTILTSPQVSQNGFWGDDQHEHHPKEAKNGWYVCPPNTYINGISVQRYAEGDDHFGVAHFAFKCVHPENGTKAEHWVLKTPGLSEHTVKPLEPWYECKDSAVAIGFQLNSQPGQGDDEDDVATDNVLLDCSCGMDAVNDMSEDEVYGPIMRGEWTVPRICMPKQALCGFQGQFQHYYKQGEQEVAGFVVDNTGLNNLKGKCCDVKHPAEKCAPEEEKILIGTCDNLDDSKERACEVFMNIGVKQNEAVSQHVRNFYEGIGFTENCVGNLLRPRFQNNVKCEDSSDVGEDTMLGSACVYDWTTAPHQVWSHEDTFHDNVIIPGNQKANVYQIVGKCGPYLVLTNRYIVESPGIQGNTRDLVDLAHPLYHDHHNHQCWEDDKHIKSKNTGSETLQPDQEKRTFDLTTNNLTVYEIEKDGTTLISPVPTDFPEISNYTDWVFCKHPHKEDSWYVDGIYVERQGSEQPEEDLSGLVAIAFRCANTKRSGKGDHVIQSITPGAPIVDDGAWDWKSCKCGAGVGFQVSAVSSLLLADDLAVESMKMKCSCGDIDWIWKTKDEFPTYLQGLRGNWTGEQLCRPREAMCGLQTRSKPFQLPSEKEQAEPGAGLAHYDNIGITRVKVKCCSVPNPALRCEPKESVKEIAVCDNTEQDVKKRCKVETILGVTYDTAELESRNEADFLESIGWSLNCIVDELEENFVEHLGKSNASTDYLWQGSREVWTVAQGIIDFVDMDERSKTTIYQIVGECGPYVVATDRFLRRDSSLKSNEDDVDEEFYDTKATVKPLHSIKPGCWAEMGRFQARDYIFPNASNEIPFHRLPGPDEFTVIITPQKTGIVLESPPTKKLIKQGQVKDENLDGGEEGKIQKKECPEGSYMTGYATDNTVLEKSEEGGTKDDLGMTHLMVRCRQPDRQTKAKGLSVHDYSTEINVNKLKNLHMPCLGGLLVGFQVSSLPPPHRGVAKTDRYGIDNLRMICSWGHPLQNLQPIRAPWEENQVMACRPYQALCDLTAIFGMKSVSNWEVVDGRGIVQLKMTCCDVPSPVMNAIPTEILRLASVCDNTQFAEDRICDYTMDLGVTYDFQEHRNEAVSFLSIGYTVPCILSTVKELFQNMTTEGNTVTCGVAPEEGTCHYDWGDAVDQGRVFQAGVSTHENSTIVKGGQRIDFYQVSGKVNNVLVLTNHFVAVTKALDGTVLGKQRMVVELGRFPSLDIEDSLCNLTNFREKATPDITREDDVLQPENEQTPPKRPKEAEDDDQGEEIFQGDEIERPEIPESPASKDTDDNEDGPGLDTPDDDDGWEIFMDAEVEGKQPWLDPVKCDEGTYMLQMAPNGDQGGISDDKPIQGVQFKCSDSSGKQQKEHYADSKTKKTKAARQFDAPGEGDAPAGEEAAPADAPPGDAPPAEEPPPEAPPPSDEPKEEDVLLGRDDKPEMPVSSYPVCACRGSQHPVLPFGVMVTVKKDKTGGKITNLDPICSCNGKQMVEPFDEETVFPHAADFKSITDHNGTHPDDDDDEGGEVDITSEKPEEATTTEAPSEVFAADEVTKNIKPKVLGKLPPGNKVLNYGNEKKVALYCPPRKALCGVQLQQKHKKKGGVKKMQLKCCDIPPPTEECKTEDKLVKAVTCDNQFNQLDRVCEFDLYVGVTYDTRVYEGFRKFYERSRWNLACVNDRLATKFSNQLGEGKSSTPFNWDSSAKETPLGLEWQEMRRALWNMSVNPMTKLEVFQTVGRCGMYLIYTDEVYVIETNAETGEIKKTPKQITFGDGEGQLKLYEDEKKEPQKCWTELVPIIAKTPILTNNEPPVAYSVKPDAEKDGGGEPGPNGTIYESLKGPPGLIPFHGFPNTMNGIPSYTGDEKDDITGMWYYAREGNPEEEKYTDESKILCDPKSFVRKYGGFPLVGEGSETVLDSIYFMCSKPESATGKEYELKKDAEKAPPPTTEKYPYKAIGGFIGMNTKPIKESIANSIPIDSIMKIEPPAEEGYDKKEYCPPGLATCGYWAAWDDEGAKNLKFFCCSVDSPGLTCNPREKIVPAAICDNRGETRKRRCDMKLGVGIMYSIGDHPLSSYFHSSVGYTPNCIAEDLKTKYQSMECAAGVGCMFDWGGAPAEIWKGVEVTNETTEVEPNQIVEYRQQIGSCVYDGGEVLILTPTFRRVVLDSALQELQNDAYIATDVPNKEQPAVCPYTFLNLTVPPTPSPIIDETPLEETSANVPQNDSSHLHPFHGMTESDLLEYIPGEGDTVIIPGPFEAELKLNLETIWREWQNCTTNKFVQKFEVYSGGVNDAGPDVTFGGTGVTSGFTDPMGVISVIGNCLNPKGEESEEIKLISTHKEDNIPENREKGECSAGAAAVGFEARFKRYMSPPSNNVAYTNFKLLCSFGHHLVNDAATEADTDVGEWEPAQVCRPREAICGLLMSASDFIVGQPIEIHDNTGISSLKAKCCDVQSPAVTCEAKEEREEALTCNNVEFDNDRQCITQLFIGLSYIFDNADGEKPSFYESTGWTLDCVKEELSNRFATVIGKSQVHPEYDWTSDIIQSTTEVEENKMWYRVVQQEKVFDVPKRSGFKLMQIVGTCGIYKVHTNKFIKVNLVDNSEEPVTFIELGNSKPDLCWADKTPLKGRNWVLVHNERHPPALLKLHEYESSKENVFRFDPPDNSDRQGMMAKMPVTSLPADKWSTFILCPVDSYLRSISVKKIEKKTDDKTDVVGMVAVSFHCMTPSMNITRSETIVHPSFEKELEEWRDAHLGKPGTRYQTCIGGAVGVEYQYSAGGGADEYGIYDARWLCGIGRDTNFVPLADHAGLNPHTAKGLVCRPRQSLCQIQASFAPGYDPAIDNMGITNMKMACCPVPSPIATCTGTDVLTYAVTCDNTKYNRKRKCKFQIGFGVQYDFSPVNEKASLFYLSVGYTPNCITDSLREKFLFWGDDVPDQLFQEVVKVQREIDVPAKSRVDIYQTVGTCNMVQVLTHRFMHVTVNDKGEEIEKTPMDDKNLPPYDKKPCEKPPETGELEPPVMPPPENLKNLDAPKRPTLPCTFKDRLDTAIYSLAGDGSNFIEGIRELNIEFNHKSLTWEGYQWQNCSPGRFFTGFKIHQGELEVPVAEGDPALGKRKDSYGIDALAMQCGNPLKGTPEEILEIHSQGSPVKEEDYSDGNKLKEGLYCDAGAAIGFSLGMKPFQKTGDDESIDSFKLHCSCGNDMSDGKAAQPGEEYEFWTEARYCRPKEALCGFSVKAQEITAEKTIMTHDNIGIANIRTKCCTVPSPVPDLAPEEKLNLVAKCDNKDGHEMKRCIVDLYVGLGYTYQKDHMKQIYFYDTVGYTLNVVRKEVAQKFGTSLGETERYNWGEASTSTIWNRIKDKKENMTAAIGVEIQLYQIVGVAGFFKVRTNKFVFKEINVHANTEKEVSIIMNDIANPLANPSWEMVSPIRGRDWMITWSTAEIWWQPRDQYPIPTKLETLDKITDVLNQDTTKYGMIIQTPNPINLGFRWDDWRFCPNGTFIRAWTSVSAGKMLQGDDHTDDYSGTVLIKALCQSADNDPSVEQEIMILQQNNGWEHDKWLRQGRIPMLYCVGAGIGIQGKIQNVPKPSEDQFFFHDTKLICSSGQDAGFMREGPDDTPCDPIDVKQKHRDNQVENHREEVCKPRQALCGLRVSWGSNNIGNHKIQDGSGVTNLLGLCCDVPSPVSNCKKSLERIVFASACDNSRGSVPRRCMFNLVIGVAFDYHEDEVASYFYASNGFTPTCITGEVKTKFSSMPPKPCLEEGCNYDWTNAPVQIWQETITISQMKDVDAHQRFRMYQVIGECDAVTVLTNQFIKVVADQDENELSREVWLLEDLPPPKQKKCEM